MISSERSVTTTFRTIYDVLDRHPGLQQARRVHFHVCQGYLRSSRRKALDATALQRLEEALTNRLSSPQQARHACAVTVVPDIRMCTSSAVTLFQTPLASASCLDLGVLWHDKRLTLQPDITVITSTAVRAASVGTAAAQGNHR